MPLASRRSFTIARLANAADVNVETVRYYQRLGLMPTPQRPPGGIRRYTKGDAERLRFIKRAQGMGFTLAETARLLKLNAQRSCRATRQLAATKLQLLDARIEELRTLRRQLARLIAKCDRSQDDTACPVLDQLVLQARSAG